SARGARSAGLGAARRGAPPRGAWRPGVEVRLGPLGARRTSYAWAMRRRFALVVLLVSACSRSETRRTAVDAAPASPTPRSRGSVSAGCGAAPCRDYSTATAHIRKRATPGQGTGCSNASIGRCGAARYIHFSDGFITFEEYFDASGAMIAAYSHSDIDPG